jgi:hypothetical protein
VSVRDDQPEDEGRRHACGDLEPGGKAEFCAVEWLVAEHGSSGDLSAAYLLGWPEIPDKSPTLQGS